MESFSRVLFDDRGAVVTQSNSGLLWDLARKTQRSLFAYPNVNVYVRPGVYNWIKIIISFHLNFSNPIKFHEIFSAESRLIIFRIFFFNCYIKIQKSQHHSSMTCFTNYTKNYKRSWVCQMYIFFRSKIDFMVNSLTCTILVMKKILRSRQQALMLGFFFHRCKHLSMYFIIPTVSGRHLPRPISYKKLFSQNIFLRKNR